MLGFEDPVFDGAARRIIEVWMDMGSRNGGLVGVGRVGWGPEGQASVMIWQSTWRKNEVSFLKRRRRRGLAEVMGDLREGGDAARWLWTEAGLLVRRGSEKRTSVGGRKGRLWSEVGFAAVRENCCRSNASLGRV